MYKLIVLILSSHDHEVYQQMKEISEKYHNKYLDKIKYFYIEYNDTIDTDVKEDGNHIYVKGQESGHVGPGMYMKTVKALEYVTKTYSYEFIMRTNLSSFLHLENIMKYIDMLPKNNFAGGFPCSNFISGTGIFVSRDVANILVQDVRFLLQSEYEDVNISNILRDNNIELSDLSNYCVVFLINNQYDESISIPENLLYYRIKNEADRNIDVMYFKLLLNKIYDII